MKANQENSKTLDRENETVSGNDIGRPRADDLKNYFREPAGSSGRVCPPGRGQFRAEKKKLGPGRGRAQKKNTGRAGPRKKTLTRLAILKLERPPPKSREKKLVVNCVECVIRFYSLEIRSRAETLRCEADAVIDFHQDGYTNKSCLRDIQF